LNWFWDFSLVWRERESAPVVQEFIAAAEAFFPEIADAEAADL
jgi:hypothetical protein